MKTDTKRLISTRPPDPNRAFRLVEMVSETPYSYVETGATRGEVPPGYNVDRYSTTLGQGNTVFETAKAALSEWVPFRLPWIRTFAQASPSEDVCVAVAVHLVGLWWINISRVIYTIDEPDRFGFAYGTLTYHAEMGEEQFLVHRDPATGIVTYSILAFSKPRHLLAKLGYPLARAAQRRFGAGSLEAMRRETVEKMEAGET